MTLEDGITPEPESGVPELPVEYQQALSALDSPSSSAALPESAAERESPSAQNSPATAVPAAATAASAAPANRDDENRQAAPSWQPDEKTRETAIQYGLSDEALRSFGSAENFSLWRAQTDRVMLELSNRRAAQQAQQPAPTPQPQAAQPAAATPGQKSPIDEFIDSEYTDPDLKKALIAIRDQQSQQQQYLAQLHQREQEQQQQVVTRLFDQAIDKVGFENLGNGEQLSDAHIQARAEVYKTLAALGQAGIISKVDEDSVQRAYSVAFPREYQNHLKRSIVTSARAQAQARTGDGRFTKPAEKPFDGPVEKDPELHDAYRELVANA